MRFKNILAHLNPDAPRRGIFACHYETARTVGSSYVGGHDAGAPCAMLLNLATTMTSVFDQQNSDLAPTLLFFDGEEAMQAWSNTDSLYGSKHLVNDWKQKSYNATSDGFCQTEAGIDYLDRIEFLFLLDLVGADAPYYPEFKYENCAPNPFYAMMKEIETNLDNLFPVASDPLYSGYEYCFSKIHTVWGEKVDSASTVLRGSYHSFYPTLCFTQ